MRLSYDPETDSLYIHLVERPSADSDEVADGVVLDFDEAGGIVGIDVQHASQHAGITPRKLVNVDRLNAMRGTVKTAMREGLAAAHADFPATILPSGARGRLPV